MEYNDTTNTSVPTPSPQVQVGSGKSNNSWLMWLLVALLILALSAAGYLWWQLDEANNKNQALESQVSAQKAALDKANEQLKAAGVTADTTCNNVASDTMKQDIKAALDSKNTAAFSGYFSNPVSFIIAASEKGGDETPAQAVADLEYIKSATGPWNFNLPQETLDAYAAGPYKAYFNDKTYVGMAASGQVAAFNFDCNGKIKQVFLAPSEDVLKS